MAIKTSRNKIGYKVKRPTLKQVRELPPEGQLFLYLQDFAERITAKFTSPAAGEPEDHLRAPVEKLLSAYGEIISRNIVLAGESKLRERLGKPDYAATDGAVIIGYIEIKAPGKGTSPDYFKGHDRDQWKRFQSVPNIIYTDGNEWALFRSGELEAKRLRLSGDVRTDGRSAAAEADARALFQLLAEFSSWRPIVPQKPKELAEFLAPYCRLIRDDVLDGVSDTKSSLRILRDEIKRLLFPEATDQQFADAYAQTIIFALLLAQSEGADVLDLASAYKTLESHHLLLSRALQFLTDRQALQEISSSVSLAQRVIHEVSLESMKTGSAGEDPWLFFYEYFLAKYDPKLRKSWGVYYTPVEVVRCQVRLIDEILSKHLGRNMGFVEPGVITLDPALGTGTYLLTIIDHALKRVEEEEGEGAVKGGARSLIHNLHGFEWMVGPYAVSQLRFAGTLTAHGATIPLGGLGIYLTNTLESPHIRPPAPPLFHKPIAQEHERALKIKDAEHVLVCLGNPPYGRHEAADEMNRAVTGGWVRYGDKNEPPILMDFIESARKAGHGVHLKNLYNQYVYFIRWALWKVFEHKTATGPGIVSFITAASYLDGDAFSGLREHMRRVCDQVYIIDLGGEGRGTRKEKNVFAIQTPVAIFIAWRKSIKATETPALTRYVRIEGNRAEKLNRLDNVRSFQGLQWQDVPSDWQAPFRPRESGDYACWPHIKELFPWQNNGVKAGRTWVIDPTENGLKEKLSHLFGGEPSEQAELFKESPTGRKLRDKTHQLPPSHVPLLPLYQEKNSDGVPIRPYSYRSFDRQCIIADARFLDRPSPPLWQAHSERQVYFASLFSNPLGKGQGLTCCAEIPDLDFFRGSYGAKAILPLYRDPNADKPNILPGLLHLLSGIYDRSVTPEDFAGYVYSTLAHPEYTSRFARVLESRQVRVPLTKDSSLFFKAGEFGKRLIWLHTYGERMTSKVRPKGKIPTGKAKCIQAVSDKEEDYPIDFSYDSDSKTLRVGDGRFGPLEKDIYGFEVSGLKVIKSWLGYRMRERAGKKSSPLDDIRPQAWTYEFTRELLELLWVLEMTVEGYPDQKELFYKIIGGDLIKANDLPPVPEWARQAPKAYPPGDLNLV